MKIFMGELFSTSTKNRSWNIEKELLKKPNISYLSLVFSV